MKVCIPIGKDIGIKSILWKDFSSAPYFAIVDTHSLEISVIPNEQISKNIMGSLVVLEIEGIMINEANKEDFDRFQVAGVRVFKCKKTIVEDIINSLHDHGQHEHHHHHHHHEVNRSNKSKFILVILFNVIITITEYVGGILSGSLALISDAGHNLSDVLSLILGYAGEKVSERKPTKEFSFGLKRFEVLVALINAISLIAISIFIIHEAILRYINPRPIDLKIMLPVAIIGLLGNLFSLIVLLKSRKDSLNMKAAYLHLFYDAISSIAVIMGAIILYFTDLAIVDIIISVIIVIMIFWSSIGVITESYRIFMQGSPSYINIEEIIKSILSIKNINDVHGFHVWSISSNEIFLSCHISIKDSTNAQDGDSLIRTINTMLESKYNIRHTTIQIEKEKICEHDHNECCR